MLKAHVHLSEILQTQPEVTSLPAEQVSIPVLEFDWSPRKRLKPGRIHRFNTRINKPDLIVSPVSPGERHGSFSNLSSLRYQYSRTLSTRDQPQVIRLLRVSPGRESDPIVCRIEYISPEVPPYYEAISYCWSTQAPLATIECDESPMSITENLSAAIRSVRRESDSLLIWADAVCIDQNSFEEKNSQIPLMRSIYKNAAVVQVWLGDDTPTKSCREAFKVLQVLTRAYGKLGWNFNFLKAGTTDKALSQCRIPALNDSSWNSIIQLLQKPWFSRVWIIQEIVVSQNAILRCGSERLNWKDFHLGLLFAMKSSLLFLQPELSWTSLNFQQLISLLVTYDWFTHMKNRSFDLLSLLESHRCAGATDMKDKVYALIGLSSEIDGRTHNIIPDYSLSTADIYIEIARAIIHGSSTLDLLGVPRTTTPSFIGNIPSWVPNWSVTHLTNSFTFKSVSGCYMFDFDAAKVNQVPKRIAFRDLSLILYGHIFDTIVHVGKVMDPLTQPDINVKLDLGLLTIIYIVVVLNDWQHLCRTFASTHVYSNPTETLDAIFVRTIHLGSLLDEARLATEVKSYGRSATNIWVRIFACLVKHPTAVKTMNWWTSHVVHMAWIRASKDPRPDIATETVTQTSGRRIVVTKMGYIGLAPALAEKGDRVVLVQGGRVPLVLRQVEGSKLELIGDCYVHGIMHGEKFDDELCEEIEIV